MLKKIFACKTVQEIMNICKVVRDIDKNSVTILRSIEIRNDTHRKFFLAEYESFQYAVLEGERLLWQN